MTRRQWRIVICVGILTALAGVGFAQRQGWSVPGNLLGCTCGTLALLLSGWAERHWES